MAGRTRNSGSPQGGAKQAEIRTEMTRIQSTIFTALLVVIALSAPILAIKAETLAELPSFDRVRILQSAPEIGDVSLIDQDDRPFSLSQLKGRVTLVFFGFTNCPDVCPMALQKLRELEKQGGDDLADVAYVLISVDGERDTPSVMKAYLTGFSSRFIGLTEHPDTVKPIAADFKAAFFKGNPTKDGGYSISHSPQVFVIDQQGRLRAEFYNASIEAMMGVTLALLDEDHDTPDHST